LRGETAAPGDKSISHRAALFAAMAEGDSRIENYLVSGVTNAMLTALTALGTPWALNGTTLQVHGMGRMGFYPPQEPIYCGNSATTLRLLAGALAASGLPAVLDGSPSLCRRPMDRIVEPLRSMGVPVETAEGGCAPLQLGHRPALTPLKPLVYVMPVASAQVKSCLLLAALSASGPSVISEPSVSRDHTERMLSGMGVQIETRFHTTQKQTRIPVIRLIPPTKALQPLNIAIPADFSAAAFLIVAALTAPDSDIVIPRVGLNPTRIGLLQTLVEMGANITVSQQNWQSGEPVGDLRVRTSRLRGVAVSGERVVQMIDEFPAFAVAAAFAEGQTTVTQAQELRYKESDRISALCQELQRQGADLMELPDGFVVNGEGHLPGGQTVDAHGDHRLAMALAAAGVGSDRPVTVENAEIMAESFPDFSHALEALGADVHEVEA
jgi:3-phosphoshikimate 1-carboxyvinyltransferase